MSSFCQERATLVSAMSWQKSAKSDGGREEISNCGTREFGSGTLWSLALLISDQLAINIARLTVD